MAGAKHLSRPPSGTEQPDPEDRYVFRQAVADARPLSSNRAVPERTEPSPVARQTRERDQAARRDLASGEADPEVVETGEEAFWCRSGLQRRVKRRLKTGQFPVEAVLDLHGLRVEEARSALGTFLSQSAGTGRRCVRIIHGKGLRSPSGDGILRRKVHSWLTRRRDVLAFASCTPADGGTGAVYVLLKK